MGVVRPPVRGRLSALVSIVFVSTVGFAATSSAQVTHAAPTWSSGPTVPNTIGTALGVTCVSVTNCWIVGSNKVVHTLDGVTWHSALIGTLTQVDNMTCLTSTWCVANGIGPFGFFYSSATVDGGSNWTSTVYPTGVGADGHIQCLASGFCVSIAYNSMNSKSTVLESTNYGDTFSVASHPATGGGLVDISCTSMTHCILTGSVLKNSQAQTAIFMTTTGPTTWTRVAPQGGNFNGSANFVSCPTSTECLLSLSTSTFQDSIQVTTNGGATWQDDTSPSHPGAIAALDCPSVNICYAGANGVVTSINGGYDWTSGTATGEFSVEAISCVSDTSCMAVGSTTSAPFTAAAETSTMVQATVNAGATWSSVPTGDGLDGLRSVSCSSSTTCLALGYVSAGFGQRAVVAKTTNAGAAWTVLGNKTEPGSEVRCFASGVCFLFGDGNPFAPSIERSLDGGSTWSAVYVSGKVPLTVSAIACPTLSTCYATGNVRSFRTPVPSVILKSTNGGATWIAKTPATHNATYSDISCSSATNCAAVGEVLRGVYFYPNIMMTTDGVHWIQKYRDTKSSQFVSIKCFTAKRCLATGYGDLLTINGGTTWTFSSFGYGKFAPSLACASSLSCVVLLVDNANSLFSSMTSSNGGATWTPRALPASSAQLIVSDLSTIGPSSYLGVGFTPTNAWCALYS